MTQMQKVPATAGAEWVLGGFALLRKAPLGLGVLGLIWVGLSALAGAHVALSLVVALLGPILFAGLLYAVREVDQGRDASPTHLLQGLREGKTAALLATLLPQVIAVMLAALLLFALLGTEQLTQMTRVMEHIQANPDKPDPAVIQSLPSGRLLVWLLGVVVIGLVAGFFTLLATPQVMFSGRGGLEAMAISFRTCLHNLGAIVVMALLLFIAMFALAIASNLVMLVAALIIGPVAAAVLSQLLMMGVLLPVMSGTAYYAWRDLLGGGATPGATPPSLVNGFEA